MTGTIEFTIHEASREARDWAGKRKDGCATSIRTEAKKYARIHGAAGMAWADGRYTLYFMESGRVRQTTWKHSRYVETIRESHHANPDPACAVCGALGLVNLLGINAELDARFGWDRPAIYVAEEVVSK